jgi:signal transduction histidine kinase
MKLAGALLVPLLALFVVTALQVASIWSERDGMRSQTDLAKASTGPNGVITMLQDERSYAAVELVGAEGTITVPNADYPTSRRETDLTISRFRAEIESKGEGVAAVYADALAGLSALDGVRADIDAHPGPRDLSPLAVEFGRDIFDRYSALITPFFEANTRLSLAIDDPELRNGAALIDTTSRQIEVLADLARTTIVGITIGGGIDDPGEIVSASKLKAAFDGSTEDILAAPPPYDAVVERTFPLELTEGFSTAVGEAITTGTTDLDALFAVLDVPQDEGYLGLRADLVEVLNERADDLNRSATTKLRWYVGLAGVTLIAALALTWSVSLSITRPLRSLTRQAKDMANQRLPEAVIGILGTPLGDDVEVPQVDPVMVRTRDEVADVAVALNTVQDTALDLAVEQAVLRRNIADSFVNLGRRNQNLLGRQLDFITELENNETDADTLANLFRLDHLATRMRRNAESLLVLAGVEPPRRWAAPVRLNDVIRAALGEVEDYQRVSVRSVQPAVVVGAAATDLAHLLAELIENALVFSPSDRTVDIRGRIRPDGYTLGVIDSGMGMASDDIAAANRRLAGTESFTVAPSKYLGHYVAGSLAARHGIRVHLSCAAGTGVTATVELPADLLASETEQRGADGARSPARAAVPESPTGSAPAVPVGAQSGPSPLLGDGWHTLAETAPRSSFPMGSWQSGGPRPDAPVRSQTAAAPAGPERRPARGEAAGQAVSDEALLDALSRYTVGAGAARPLGAPGDAQHPQQRELPAVRWGPAARRRAGDPSVPTGERPAVPPAGDPPPVASSAAPPASGRRVVQPPAVQGTPPAPTPLERRVRGAQMPTTHVVRRRPAGERPAARPAPAPPDRGASRLRPQPDPAPQQGRADALRAADEVYSFLSDFSAGVQRGLDDLGGTDRAEGSGG